MTTTSEPEDLFPVVRELISECLEIDAENIERDSHFEQDLGGDSLDWEDLQFLVETRLGIRNAIVAFVNSDAWQFDSSGRLTPGSLALQKSLYPDLDWTPLTGQPGPQLPKQLMTVGNICNLIQRAASQQ